MVIDNHHRQRAASLIQYPKTTTYRFELPPGKYTVQADNGLPPVSVVVRSQMTKIVSLFPRCL